jgi:ubiquinone/menaquinone biosynthesis C-methylase UbiE/ribosomal protein L29
MSPVILFVYNRTRNLPKTLACLKKNNIDLLYVFSDGHKNAEDEKKVKKVRKLIDRINWVKTEKFYQEKNLGLSKSVIFGVNKVLEKYETVICIEDDICVAPDFYQYMEACLNKYRNDPKISGVTGLRYPFALDNTQDYPFDVFSFPRFSSWGWGTWRRFWQTIDFERETAVKKIMAAKFDASAAGGDMQCMMQALIDGTLHGGWDVYCGINMLLHNQSFIWPVWNMVKNSGLHGGTHASRWRRSWFTLRWEDKKNSQLGNLRFPNTEEEQKQIRQSFLNFFQGNNAANSKLIKIISLIRKSIAMIKSFKKTIKKILGFFGIKIVFLTDQEKKVLFGKIKPEEYSTIVGAGSFVNDQLKAYFLCLNKYVREGDKVLDVGFGLGYGLNTLAIKAKEVNGVDVDEKVLRYCREIMAGENPKLKDLKVYDGYKLDYPDNYFDVVSSVDVLEHVESYDKFLNELLRVSRRGVFISTPNRRPEYTNPDGKPKNYWHRREWSWDELKNILANHGRVDANFINGPYDGPFTLSDAVKDDTLCLSPFIFKK